MTHWSDPSLDVSTDKHGLVPTLPADITQALRGDGTWGPSGGGIIASQTLAVDSANITISGLNLAPYPAVTLHCNLRCTGTGDSSGIYGLSILQVNGQTGTNYAYLIENNNATGASNYGNTNGIVTAHTNGPANAAGLYAYSRVTVFQPGVAGQAKNFITSGNLNPDPVGGTGGASYTLATFGQGTYYNNPPTSTPAITSFTILVDTGNVAAGSSVVIVPG